MKTKTSRSRLSGLAAALALLAGVTLTQTARAQTTTWQAGDGSWFIPGNWTLGVPTSGLSAVIETDAAVSLAASSGTSVGLLVSGSGELNVSGGGILTSSESGILGRNGSSGTVTVSGIGSRWEITGASPGFHSGVLYVGWYLFGEGGTGHLNILDGGQVINTHHPVGSSLNSYIGYAYGHGTVTVAGSGSLWRTANVRIGGGYDDGGNGSLTVENGGKVEAEAVQVGGAETGAGSIAIRGANSQLALTTPGGGVLLQIGGGAGQYGDGSVTVADGGAIVLNGITWSANIGLYGKGKLTIGEGGAAGTIQAADIAGAVVGESTPEIVFNHDEESYDFSTRIWGGLKVIQQGVGTTLLSGDNSYLGGTTVSAGTLVAGHRNALGSGAVTITGGVLTLGEGVSITNTINLAGGTFARQVAADTDLAGFVNTTSDLGEGPSVIAQLLGGTTSAPATIEISFSQVEGVANPVFHLSGVPAIGPAPGQTDVFVLQLSFTETGPGTFLAWLNGGNQWVNAIEGNFGNNPAFVDNPFAYSFATFQSLHPGLTLEESLGAWGTYAEEGTTYTWAVLNHNSDFTIQAVPEPGIWTLLALGAATLLLRRKRNAQSAHLPGFATVLALLAGAFASQTLRAASFQGLGMPAGDTYAEPYGVSADGSVVVGASVVSTFDGEAFRWTGDGGFIKLGDFAGSDRNSLARGVSGDGSLVAGSGRSTLGAEAFRWTAAGGMLSLGDLSGGGFGSAASAVSADGTVIVGFGTSAGGNEAFRWTSAGGMVGLGDLAGGSFGSNAAAVSSDGSVVAGNGQGANGQEAFRWTAETGMVGLGDLSGGIFASGVTGISSDGSVIAGFGVSASGFEAMRWTLETGMVGLGDLPGGSFESGARGISGDGSIIVGFGRASSGAKATIWDSVNGMRDLNTVLAADYGLDLTGWTLTIANAISADGSTIVGFGSHNGQSEGWVARIAPPVPEPSTWALLALGFGAWLFPSDAAKPCSPGRAKPRISRRFKTTRLGGRLADPSRRRHGHEFTQKRGEDQ